VFFSRISTDPRTVSTRAFAAPMTFGFSEKSENRPTHLFDVDEPGHHGDGAFLLAVQAGVCPHHWSFGVHATHRRAIHRRRGSPRRLRSGTTAHPRLRDLSTLSQTARGCASVLPESVSRSNREPSSEAVHPGRVQGWLSPES